MSTGLKGKRLQTGKNCSITWPVGDSGGRYQITNERSGKKTRNFWLPTFPISTGVSLLRYLNGSGIYFPVLLIGHFMPFKYIPIETIRQGAYSTFGKIFH